MDQFHAQWLYSYHTSHLLCLSHAQNHYKKMKSVLGARLYHRTTTYIWLESALYSIFQFWMSRNQGQSLCSHSLNFYLLSKLFGIYLNHTTVSPQNFGKSPTHQKSPFLGESILENGLLVRSSPHIHKNSKISKTDKGMFMKF